MMATGTVLYSQDCINYHKFFRDAKEFALCLYEDVEISV